MQVSAAVSRGQASVGHVNGPARPRRNDRVMRDHQQSCSGVARTLEQQVDDRASGLAVEVSGRLVGQQQFRPRCSGAGDRYPLLLSAGQLGGVMRKTMAKADLLQFERGPAARIVDTSKLQRHRHILERGHCWEEVEGLQNDPERATAKPCKRVLIQAAYVLAREPHLPGVGPLKARYDRHQRAFARAGRTEDGYAFASIQLQADALQDFGSDFAFSQGKADVSKLDQWLFHRKGS